MTRKTAAAAGYALGEGESRLFEARFANGPMARFLGVFAELDLIAYGAAGMLLIGTAWSQFAVVIRTLLGTDQAMAARWVLLLTALALASIFTLCVWLGRRAGQRIDARLFILTGERALYNSPIGLAAAPIGWPPEHAWANNPLAGLTGGRDLLLTDAQGEQHRINGILNHVELSRLLATPDGA